MFQRTAKIALFLTAAWFVGLALTSRCRQDKPSRPTRRLRLPRPPIMRPPVARTNAGDASGPNLKQARPGPG